MNNLKPCPFCGAKIIKVTGAYRKTQMFVCHKCGADVCFYGAEYEPKASKAWNRRAEPVKEQDSPDVVEVVRCKDCIFLFDNGLCFENIKGTGYKKPNPNDFCNYGERKEGE